MNYDKKEIKLKNKYELKLRVNSHLIQMLDETASRLSLSRNAIVRLLIDKGIRNSTFIQERPNTLMKDWKISNNVENFEEILMKIFLKRN